MQNSPQWQPMETAPRDGRQILLTDGLSSVHIGWFRSSDEPYPWFIIDDFSDQTREDGVDCVELNSATERWPVAWMPLPAAPSPACLVKAFDKDPSQ